MKRRSFIAQGTAGLVGAGMTGCARSVKVERELSPYAFDKEVPKPVGSLGTTELGTTGITVSKFGFGSHMRQDIIRFEKERERMVREAFDMGVNLFDVYDHEHRVYQYEPMGRYLAPVIDDAVISISLLPWEGRTVEQEFERDLRLFGREYIDMVRIHSYSPDSSNWYQWDHLFKWKDEGKIRAVGIPIHKLKDIEEPLEKLPLDYVIFPFNYYHNWTWASNEWEVGYHDTYEGLVPRLREKGIGIITMKPFAGDNLIYPFRRLAAQFDETGGVNLAKASLKYVINAGLDIDTTLGGMYYPFHLYENLDAFFHPSMTDQERLVLKKIRERAKVVARHYLPDHYQFLEEWVPDTWNDSDLFGGT